MTGMAICDGENSLLYQHPNMPSIFTLSSSKARPAKASELESRISDRMTR